MERVTERLSNKNPCNDCKVDRQIGNPNRWECECDRCDKPNDWKSECVKKLAEYETAEEEGRMMIFPCKVGDVVYVTERRYYNYLWHTGVQKGRVYGFEYDKGWFVWVSLDDDSASSGKAYKLENFAKTVFLTYEEAERALEAVEKNNATN